MFKPPSKLFLMWVPGMGFLCGGGVKLDQKVIVPESMSFQESDGGSQGFLLCYLWSLSLCQHAQNCQSQPKLVEYLVQHWIYLSLSYHPTMTSAILSHYHIPERIHGKNDNTLNRMKFEIYENSLANNYKSIDPFLAWYFLVVNL